MAAKITTLFGHAVPPAPRHSVTVHIPKWENVEKFGADPRAMIATLTNVYPRMKPHQDIAKLSVAVLKHLNIHDKACLLFPSFQSATECIAYSTAVARDNGVDKKPLLPEDMYIRALRARDSFCAVIFPLNGLPVVGAFWASPGVGVSSRFAEDNLHYIDSLAQTEASEVDTSRPNFETPAHDAIRERIIYYLNRAALMPGQHPRPVASDIYFYPTGMASIYKPHTYFCDLYDGTTVLFGMAFISTVAVFQEIGAGYKFFGMGTSEDLENLEAFLENESRAGRKVQAIWTEFPANPILVSADLNRLRSLATKHDVVLVVDDTIGGFANIDVLYIADLLVTSLTKSFNGYADAIAGSAVLNPASPKYPELKAIFDKKYIPELYLEDAKTIEHNSRDFLVRTAKLNHNAISLVEYVKTFADNPSSSVVAVHYPSTNPSGKHYRTFMRRTTEEFTPGYGCLFTIEFTDLTATKAFYDNLNIHNGPHLGAPFTLAFAYTASLFGTKLDWVGQYGLKPTQIRISAGLEDTTLLIEEFRIAIEAADRARGNVEDGITV